MSKKSNVNPDHTRRLAASPKARKSSSGRRKKVRRDESATSRPANWSARAKEESRGSAQAERRCDFPLLRCFVWQLSLSPKLAQSRGLSRIKDGVKLRGAVVKLKNTRSLRIRSFITRKRWYVFFLSFGSRRRQ